MTKLAVVCFFFLSVSIQCSGVATESTSSHLLLHPQYGPWIGMNILFEQKLMKFLY